MANDFDSIDGNHLDADLIGAELPAPHEEEPASLRQDIIDELSDHLLCAQQREQFRGDATPAAVWQRVLDNFGSPAAVARQLWWNWMWEKRLMQRLSLGLATLALVCCLAMFFVIWHSSQALIASQTAQQAMLTALEQRLTQLDKTPTESSQPAEWNELNVKLVYDDEARTPVVGAEIRLDGTSPTNEQLNGYLETTDATGEADFGTLLYGTYSVDVVLPSGIVSLDREVVIRPGQDKLEVIVCPKTAHQEIEVAPIELPKVYQNLEFYQGKRIWYVLHFHQTSDQPEWHGQSEGGVTALIGPDGVCVLTPHWEWQNLMPAFGTEVDSFGEIADPELSDISRYPAQYAIVPDQLEFKRTIRLPLGNYECSVSCQMLMEKEHDGQTVLVSAPYIPFHDFTEPSPGSYAGRYIINRSSIQKWDFLKVDAFQDMEQRFLKRNVPDEPLQVSNGDLIRPICRPGDPLLFWLAEQMPPETALVRTDVMSKTPLDEIGPQDIHVYAQYLGTEFRPNEAAEAPAAIMLAQKEQRGAFGDLPPLYTVLAATHPKWIIAKGKTSVVATTYDPREKVKDNEPKPTLDKPR